MKIPRQLRKYSLIKICPPHCASHPIKQDGRWWWEEGCFNAGKRAVPEEKGPRGARFGIHSPEEVTEWLQKGGNAGALARGQLVFIDVDDPEVDEIISPHLPPTFTVQSGKGSHYYYHCYEWNENVTFRDFDGEIASFRADDQYVVIPPSVHPSGNCYEVAEDRPVRTLDGVKLETVKSLIEDIVDNRVEEDDSMERERTAIGRLLDELPEDAGEDSSLVPDTDRQSAIESVLDLKGRERTWQMWMTGWLRAVGLSIDEVVDTEIIDVVMENARQEEFDLETTLRRVEEAIER